VNIAAAIFVDGLIDASWLFIVAVGLTLVFGVLNILNFAHGSLFAVGAYTAASAVGWYYGGNFGPAFLGYFVMLGAALLVAVALGPLLERGVLRLLSPRRGGDRARHLRAVPHSRRRDQADLGGEPVLRL